MLSECQTSLCQNASYMENFWLEHAPMEVRRSGLKTLWKPLWKTLALTTTRGKRSPKPCSLTWCHQQGSGSVWFTASGDSEEQARHKKVPRKQCSRNSWPYSATLPSLPKDLQGEDWLNKPPEDPPHPPDMMKMVFFPKEGRTHTHTDLKIKDMCTVIFNWDLLAPNISQCVLSQTAPVHLVCYVCYVYRTNVWI